MTKADMLNTIYEYLAQLMECEVADFTREETTFSVRNIEEPFLKIMICGNSIVVTASPNLYSKAVSLLENKSRDELFECPLVYGQTIHYIPDLSSIFDPALPNGFTYSLFQGEDINNLSDITGFDNSLVFDSEGNTSTQIVFVAKKGEDVIGIAGAGVVTDTMWEVGIDVKEEYRNGGLGSKLVKKLTLEILKKGIVPFYSASVTNVGSQMVASRVGYIPCWVDTFGNIFDEYYAYDIEAVIGNLKEIHNDCINCSTCKKSSDR